MPTNSRELSIILSLKDRASKDLKTFHGRVERLQPTFQKMAIAGTAAFAGIGFGVKKAVDEASRVQEIDRLFQATFSNSRKEVADWAEEISDEFGRAEHDMRSLAATSASVLKAAFDVPEQQIADLTTGMGQAAIALAATDTRIDNAQQAMEGFTQALVGNRQRVIDWGFQVREAQLEQEALERGIISANEELTHQQKAMLTAKLITEQVSVSTEVLAQSQEDWSQVSKRLSGQMSELMAAVGNQFLPIIEKLGAQLAPVLGDIADWVKANPTLTRNLIIAAAAIAGVTAVLGALGLAVLTITPAIGFLTTVVGGLGTALLFLAANPIGVLITALGIFIFWLIKTRKEGESLKDRLLRFWEQIKGGIKEVVDIITGYIEAFIDNTIGWAIEKIEGLIEKVQNAIASVKSAASSIGGFLGGIGSGVVSAVSNIAPRAHGGPVTGGQSYVVGENGPELFTPAGNGNITRNGRLGGGNITINVYGDVSGEELLNKVREGLMSGLREDTRFAV